MKEIIKLIVVATCLLMVSFTIVSLGGEIDNQKNKAHREATDSIYNYQTYGVISGRLNNLPVFYSNLAKRLTFPMSWTTGAFGDFKFWKRTAQNKVKDCIIYMPPPVSFNPTVVAVEDRGSYVAQQVAFNISADSRVLGYMLIPKEEGSLPAVLLLHDHGSRFDIGKEKVVKPFNVSKEKLSSSKEWIQLSYGGKYIGDELAKKGYVCFVTDMLNWSDRGGAEYEGQQALASNMFRLGSSLAGTIAYEDIRAAEFLASQPYVDSSRISALGHSVGGYRAWQVAALSENIHAGISICWMTTIKGTTIPGNNAARGQSAYTMTHPGLYNFLDFPDIASIACPKPMLFYNGLKDKLFPVTSVKNAYQKMQQVWDSQNAGDKLVTKLWDEEHRFSKEMQEGVFKWLDNHMKSTD